MAGLGGVIRCFGKTSMLSTLRWSGAQAYPTRFIYSCASQAALVNRKNVPAIMPPKTSLSTSVVRLQEAAAVPDYKKHSHVTMWSAERVLAIITLGIIPSAFMFSMPALDYGLAFCLTLHSHWGIEAVVLDYVRPVIFGPVIPKIGIFAVYAVSAITLGCLFYFNYTDVGLTEAIKMLWRL